MFKVEGKVSRIFYQKINEDGSKFYTFVLDDVVVLEGNKDMLSYNKYGCLSIQGELEECFVNKTITVDIAFYKNDIKHGVSYKIANEHINFELNNVEDLKSFVNTLDITERQKEILLQCDNIIEYIKTSNIEEITKLKGIGEFTAQRIIDKYEKNKEVQAYHEILFKMGFENTSNRTKIINHYLSEIKEMYKKHYENENEIPKNKIDSALKKKFKEISKNPYILMDIDGFGLQTVDEIAINYLKVPFNSIFRVRKFAEHILLTEGNKGRSYLPLNDFLNNLKTQLETLKEGRVTSVKNIDASIIIKAIKELIQEGKVFVNKENTKIALKYFYDLELNVCNELKRIQENVSENFNIEDIDSIIADVEKEQGFNFSDEQRQAIKTLSSPENGVSVLTGAAGCVDMDTEFFTGTGWKKISEYEEGDKVLQYNSDGSTTLVSPLRYIKQPKEYLWHFQTKYGCNQCLSDNHVVVYETSKGNLFKKQFSDVKKMHENAVGGFSGKFYTTFKYKGIGIDLSEEEIRLMCAVICDGTFSEGYKTSPNTCRINLKKERKKIRLEGILERADISYRKVESTVSGCHYYYFEAPMKTKEFDEFWYSCSSEQLAIICDEILHWDGCLIDRKTFSTTSKKTADFVQFAFASQGSRAVISTRDRVGNEYTTNGKTYTRKSIEYTVSITNRNKISIGGFHGDNPNKTKINPYKTKDGYEYCFTVPSSMLVLRRGDRIFITGNCGKTTVTTALHRIFEGFKIAQLCFAGKASQRMAEVTGKEASTIHMHLAKLRNTEDTDINTYDIYIVDEASMIHLELMLSLLRTIPNGAKLFILGDKNQLQSLTTGNLLEDIINSNSLPVAMLTRVYRQGLASGILSTSVKVRNQEQLCKYKEDKDVILGEKQDLRLITRQEDTGLVDLILQSYVDYFKETENVLDIQVLAPLNNRGKLSVFNLNQKIQSLLSPFLSETYFESKDLKFHIGDKVVCTQNNYKAKTEEGDKTAVFNGSIGIIVDFVMEKGLIKGLVIDFLSIGRVIYSKEDCSNISLAYALTVHKCQGSEFKNVIYALSSEAYTLLNKENVYTGITRAKKHCTVIAQSSALHKAISTSELNTKLTFLENMLKSK